jgi:hypothetical protein
MAGGGGVVERLEGEVVGRAQVARRRPGSRTVVDHSEPSPVHGAADLAPYSGGQLGELVREPVDSIVMLRAGRALHRSSVRNEREPPRRARRDRGLPDHQPSTDQQSLDEQRRREPCELEEPGRGEAGDKWRSRAPSSALHESHRSMHQTNQRAVGDSAGRRVTPLPRARPALALQVLDARVRRQGRSVCRPAKQGRLRAPTADPRAEHRDA